MGVETKETKEINEHEDVSFKLVRPTPGHVYRVLECTNCGNDTMFEIGKADNGQWNVECLSCEDSAVTLSDLINSLQ